MRIKLAENIKAFRKERKMTQEQLAEALGVTVGTIHKWEKKLSTPELSLIFAMADLFGISTDVLLGYEWRNGNTVDFIKQIQQMIMEKKFEEAVAEAEKAIKKFPNNFEIVYQGAMAYLEWSRTFEMEQGLTDWQEKAHTRGDEIFRHALELLSQNTDPTINYVSLCRQLAHFHEFCTHIYEAVEVLKESNVCGINDALIGYLYVAYIHDPAKAEEYLGKAYTSLLDDLDSVILGFADTCARRGDADHAIAYVEWLRKIHRGIQPENSICAIDWYDAFLLRTQALFSCQKGDYESAKAYLREAQKEALRYDNAVPDNLTGIEVNRIMHIQSQPRYVGFAAVKTAMQRLDEMANFSDEYAPHLAELWMEVKEETLK